MRKKRRPAKISRFYQLAEEKHPDRFSKLPSLWQMIYDIEDPASYRSFRIVLDPDTKAGISA